MGIGRRFQHLGWRSVKAKRMEFLHARRFARPRAFSKNISIMRILPKITKPFLTLTEAADLARVSHWTLRRDIRGKRLACFRRNGGSGKIRISPRDLEAYLLRGRQPAVVEAHGITAARIRCSAIRRKQMIKPNSDCSPS